MLQSQAPQATFSPCSQSAGGLGAQHLPAQQFASAYGILGLHMRFHLPKGFHCFRKCFRRPHNKGCILTLPVQTIKSCWRFLTLEKVLH